MSESPRHHQVLARRVRRAGLTLLPARQRARLRELYETMSAPALRAHGTCAEGGDSFTVSLPDPLEFRTTPENRDSIAAYFRDREPAAEVAAFWKEARRPGLLFDVGANIGLFSLLHCLAHPANRAIAFEPSTMLAARAERQARLNGVSDRCTVVPRAVADTSGSRQMHVSGRDGYTQIAQFEGTRGDHWHTVNVELTTLDDAASAFGPPTLVKIDVEGYEWEVLQGARTLLGTVRPVILLELHLNFLEERGVDARGVLELLAAHRYELFRLSGRPISPAAAVRSWASVLHLVARPATAVRT